MEHVCSVEQPTPWGGKGCKKGGKKESREKYSLCAGGVDWRVVGDEEGEGEAEILKVVNAVNMFVLFF